MLHFNAKKKPLKIQRLPTFRSKKTHQLTPVTLSRVQQLIQQLMWSFVMAQMYTQNESAVHCIPFFWKTIAKSLMCKGKAMEKNLPLIDH
jgi:hypothetical protein